MARGEPTPPALPDWVPTAAEIAAAVRARELDRVESVERSLVALEERDECNAVITVCRDPAARRRRQDTAAPLAGVPLLVKDVLDTAGVRTTYGSRIYAEHVPRRTAAAVARLEAAGAVVVGKANMYEFAWGVTSRNPHWGDVRNPRRPGRTAGGSSSGNAAALAAGLVPLALGSDTGGSVRMPAACCGVVGVKPALGRISTAGCFPLSPPFDTVGPMAATVRDCALAWSALARARVPAPRIAGLAVGVVSRFPLLGPAEEERPPADERAFAAAARLEALGARAVEVELPVPAADTWPVFYAGALESHRETWPGREREYGDAVRAKLAAASRVDRAAVVAGFRALARWRDAASREPPVDLVVSPTLGLAELPAEDASELEIRVPFSAFTRPFSYLGWAAIAIGDVQLAARDDETVLAAALAWEEAYGPPRP